MSTKTIHFTSKGRTYAVEDACDLMVCFLQARREAAEETLLQIREKLQRGELENWEAYKMEKHAAKLLEFYRTKEKLVSLYAEAKKHNTELSKLLEDENIELEKFYQGAFNVFERLGTPKEEQKEEKKS